MVEFIAQMVEYNETLILCRIFIEKINFFQLFFFRSRGPQGPSWGTPGLSGTKNSMKNYGLKGLFKKCRKKFENRARTGHRSNQSTPQLGDPKLYPKNSDLYGFRPILTDFKTLKPFFIEISVPDSP